MRVFDEEPLSIGQVLPGKAGLQLMAANVVVLAIGAGLGALAWKKHHVLGGMAGYVATYVALAAVGLWQLTHTGARGELLA